MNATWNGIQERFKIKNNKITVPVTIINKIKEPLKAEHLRNCLIAPFITVFSKNDQNEGFFMVLLFLL